QCGLLCSLERQRLWIHDCVGARLLSQQFESAATTNVLSSFVSHEIRCDGEQPRPFTHDGLLSDRAEKRLLRYLLRPIAVPQPPREIAHERLVVFAKEAVDVVHRMILTTPSRARQAAPTTVRPRRDLRVRSPDLVPRRRPWIRGRTPTSARATASSDR